MHELNNVGTRKIASRRWRKAARQSPLDRAGRFDRPDRHRRHAMIKRARHKTGPEPRAAGVEGGGKRSAPGGKRSRAKLITRMLFAVNAMHMMAPVSAGTIASCPVAKGSDDSGKRARHA